MIRRIATSALLAGVAWKVFRTLRDLASEDHDFVAVDKNGERNHERPLPPQAKGGDTGQFVNKDGLLIFWRRWVPRADKLKGVIILTHGLGEHCGRYEVVGSGLAKRGFAVYALDHQGHGRSEGCRLVVRCFDDYVQDALQLVALAKQQHPSPGTKVFLFGHSMGGAIAVQTARAAPELFAGVVLSAPALSADPNIATPTMVAAAKVLSKWLPKLSLDPLPADELCNEQAVVSAYVNDPLVWHGGVRARLGAELLRVFDEIFANAADFLLPVLVLHGENDKLVPTAGSVRFHAEIGTAPGNKSLIIYKGLKHEILNESISIDEAGHNQVLRDAASWLLLRC